MTEQQPDDDFDDPPVKVNRISQQYAAYPIEMLKSPAWRALSLSGRKFVDRLAIELARHAGKDNGGLPVTYENCEEHGIYDKGVYAAQREAEALGFCECTERGRGGNREYRKASLWRVTFLNSNLEPTHEWRKIKTIAEAEAIAKRARKKSNKSPRVVFLTPRVKKTGRNSNHQQKATG